MDLKKSLFKGTALFGAICISAAGLCGCGKKADPELEAYVLDAIERRSQAKKEKNFELADAIRNELLEKGVEIKDTREGVKWQLV